MPLSEAEELELLELEDEFGELDSPQQPIPQKSFIRRTGEAVINSPALPIAGGAAGAALGAGVASIPLAGIGAAGGEAYRQLAARKMGLSAPETSGQAALDIGVQGGAAMLGEGVGQAVKPMFSKAAVPFARKALGFSKRFLNTPFARRQATQAAETALQKNVIPLLGNPTSMLGRVEALAEPVGQEIGQVLKSTPGDLTKTFDDLERLRQKITKGTREGVFAKTNSAIDDVQSTLLELTGKGKEITAQTLTNIKTRIGNSVNYLSDLASQSDNKAIVSTMGNTIRNIVKAVQSPEVYQKFLGDQKLYNSYKLMVKGLNNELSSQMGNRMVSPYSVIAGAGQLATGQPEKAAATLGLVEGLMRRGPGISARSLQLFGKGAPSISRGIAQTAGPVIRKKLTDAQARAILKEAGGDKEKARQLAKDRWYVWEGMPE